jgi:hypothetical protein
VIKVKSEFDDFCIRKWTLDNDELKSLCISVGTLHQGHEE